MKFRFGPAFKENNHRFSGLEKHGSMYLVGDTGLQLWLGSGCRMVAAAVMETLMVGRVPFRSA
ncbi:MAG: hypothetical protein CMJ81_05045 [Planctomycetaceae bacterium]|nr:hypothetical protein [Planctomycetaceae bacterium]MBP63273.1 hypothetical protein [Planctomycetaceae bacterium]